MNAPAPAAVAPLSPAGFSVLILTLNEERELPDCLASVSRCDDIVVLDSGSSDRTVEIARAAGARVFVRPFDNFARQRNYAQREIPFKYPWVLHLDADERLSHELRLECGGAILEEDIDGFLVKSKVLWNGRWLRRVAQFSSAEVRFVRAPEFEFVPAGAAYAAAPAMRVGQLHTCLLQPVPAHDPAAFLERARRHAHYAAREVIAASHDRARPRQNYPLPGAPALRFISRYLLGGGFLEGRAGLHYCRLLARRDALMRAELRRLRAAR
jgi:glycosyltransferase involved in cell wall biosynthesis